MRDILNRLRMDAGQLTLAAPIQEREAAAHEIERRRSQRQPEVRAVAVRSLRQPKLAVAVPANRSPELPALHKSTLLRLKDVCAVLGMSRSTIYNKICEGSFPAPVKVGTRSVRWRPEDLELWRRGLTN